MERILILDFGSQVTQLIARRIREHNVFCEIRPYTMSLDDIKAYAPKGIILSGGPSSTIDANSPTTHADIFSLGLPILGICYGQQLTCQLLGGKVEAGHHREFGRAEVNVSGQSPLFKDVWSTGQNYTVWMSHGDRVTKIPEGFKVIATSEGAPFAAIADEQRRIYGVQFHPEVAHTPEGSKLLKNFAHGIAGARGDWTMGSFLESKSAEVREFVGKGTVLCGVSGGVDSTVVAMLLHKAIGAQLKCIFVDTGLLRKNEAAQVKELFAQANIPLTMRDASDLFLGKLAGVSDPETKRKIIGATFIDVFEEEAAKIGGADYLAQGTLYPDVIESVSVHGNASVTIKSHHNVGGLPARMRMKLVEPVRELFKDEVRALGRTLGLKPEAVDRHPFPGPGLAIRIPGEITPEKVRLLQEADAIYIEEIRKAGLYNDIWQAFAVLLPVKTVGVMGDSRTYEHVLALRAVTSTDGMTADVFPFSHEFITRVAGRIINQVRGINRVVLDVTSKPPGTIEWE